MYLIPERKLKLSTLPEGDPKDPFYIATTPRESATTFPRLLNFTFDPYFIMLHRVPFLKWFDLELNPGLLTDTLLISPMVLK